MTARAKKPVRPLIQLTRLTKSYKLPDKTEYLANNSITLDIYPGEFVSIMGPSGSGKSTLMHILGMLDTATSGSYIFDGKPVQEYTPDDMAHIRNRDIGFIFQSFNILPRTTVFKNVERPMLYAGIPAHEREQRVLQALRLVGIADKAQHLSNQISVGQTQRVAIARALIMNPKIILADEPTGNLDSKTSAEIMSLLHDLHERGSTVLIITHDEFVASFAERRLRIVDGKIVSDTKKKQKGKG